MNQNNKNQQYIQKIINKHKTTKQFIQEIIDKKIHQNEDGSLKYDYSLVEYINSYTKVKIICPEHGEFEKLPSNHLCGQGCPKCGRIDTSIKNTKTTKQFIQEIIDKKIHRNEDGSLKYDYSLVEYINSYTKVKIICLIHGEFEQYSNHHLNGCGCPKCGNMIKGIKPKTTEQFITEAKLVHNNFYNYGLVEYKHYQKNIKIICPIHGEFEQTPNNHLQGKGCIQCASEQTVSKPELQLREFINNQLNIKTINNSRNILDNNKEIDIFIKNKNIGFEFNGIFTHSLFHKNKGNNYHYNKFNDALSKGIKLYTIFEDSFINNIDSVKSFIIKKLMVKEQLLFIDDFTRNNVIFDDLPVDKFLLENNMNYQYTVDDSLIYHCLFDKNNEIIKCYIIRENTIIDIVEKNYVLVNDDITYFTGYKLMIDLFYNSPLEERFKNLKVKEMIKPQIIRKGKYDIENCGYMIYII